MKKTMRKLLTLVLTLALTASLCPAAFAAPAVTAANTMPKTVSVYGVVLPEPGAAPSTKLKVSCGYFSSVRWRDTATQTDLKAGDVFQAGHTYALDVYIGPDDGYVWAEKSRGSADVSATFYDGNNTAYPISYPGLSYNSDGITTLAVSHVFQCEEKSFDEDFYELKSIELDDVVLPSADNTVGNVRYSLSDTYNGKYELGIAYSDRNVYVPTHKLSNGDGFTPGQSYTLQWERNFDVMDVDNESIIDADFSNPDHTYLYLDIPVYLNGKNVNTGGDECTVWLEEIFTDGGCTYRLVVQYVYTVPAAEPPVITRQPQTVTGVKEGDTVTFTVQATGDDLSYHWYLCGVFPGTVDPAKYQLGNETYSGIETNKLTIRNLPPESDTMDFSVYCVVSNDGGQVQSQHAYFNYSTAAAPVITRQPADATGVSVGDTLTFTVKADGEDLSYHWYMWEAFAGTVDPDTSSFGKETITGIHSDTLTIKNVDKGLAPFSVRCVVSNPGGEVKSDYAEILFVSDPAPVITQQTEDVTGVNVGDSLTLSVKTDLGYAYAYQWYFWSAEDGTIDPNDRTFTKATITGVDSATLVIKNAVQSLDGLNAYCVVSGPGGEVKSQLSEILFTGTTVQNFADVARNDWFFDNVRKAARMGLINGKNATTFAPNDNMTYAEAIKLAACMNQLYYDGKVTLANGSANWYDTYVAYCLEKKIISQNYSGVINSPIDRQTYAAIFAKALPAKALSAKNTIPDNAIPDVKKGSACYDAIYTLYRAGIVNGNDSKGTFKPASNIKRSEVATILVRMMDSTSRIGAPAELAR